MCNIVVINTAVVVARLYWFQKRFQHIGSLPFAWYQVLTEAQASRQFVRTRSMTTSVNDANDEERAVGLTPPLL